MKKKKKQKDEKDFFEDYINRLLEDNLPFRIV